LVACVGVLGVLFMTQKNYFIHPNNIVADDTGLLNEPVLQATDISEFGTLKETFVTKPYFQEMKITTSAKNLKCC
jgi:hypothetical protein